MNALTRRATVRVRAESEVAETKELASEFTGSALFQLIGAAAPAALAAPANGLGLMAMIFAFGGTSGAHLNPAVSLMMFIRGKMTAAKALAYMAVQVAGCVVGAILCAKLTGLGAVGLLAPAVGNAGIFGWEALMTAALGLTICGAAGAAAPVGIAAAVMAAVMAAGPYTGCVINPARALGPALAFGTSWNTLAIYVGAQLAGGVLAAVVAKLVYGE